MHVFIFWDNYNSSQFIDKLTLKLTQFIDKLTKLSKFKL